MRVAWLLPAAALAHNGYVLTFSSEQIASTKTALLTSTNTEVARLASSWTLGLWAQFDDVTASRMQPPFQIVHHTDGNWLQPFAGLHEGFQFGGSGPTTSRST